MNSIKNAVVVVLLLGVAYGSFKIINTPDPNGEDQATLDAIDQGINLEIPPTDPIQQNFNEFKNSASQLVNNAQEGLSRPGGFSPPPTRPAGDTGSAFLQPPNLQSGNFQTPEIQSPEIQTPEIRAPQLQPPSIQPSTNQASSSSFQNEPVLIPPSSNPATANTLADQFDSVPRTEMVTMQQPPAPTHVDWERIRILVEERQNYRGALTLLSRYYRANPQADDREDVLTWLDSLAFKVIYSTEHNLVPTAHVVENGDTLQALASKWRVPAELIYRINANVISDPNNLLPGTQIKVIKGPFDAEIDRANGELTLYLKDMYAGRFDVALGADARITQNEYQVMAKSERGRVYQDPRTGQTYAVNDSNNPYGSYWFGLDQNTAIHSEAFAGDTRGCIRVSDQDAADLYGILSTDSKVIFR